MDQNLSSDDFWADIIAAHKLEDPPAGAICVEDFAAAIEKSETHARKILNGYVRDGVMASDEFHKPGTGKRATYYWKKE